MYDRQRNQFSESNTFITFDQRGSGKSDHPSFEEGVASSYSVERFGDDLKAVLDELGIDKAMVLGLSMGAIPALSFSIRWPGRVDRLILASAMASRLPQPIIDRARRVEDILDKKGLDAAYDFYFSGALFEGLFEENEFRNQISHAKERATPQGFKGCFRVTIDRPGLVDQLHFIKCPTLVLVGESDTHYLDEAKILERKIEKSKRVVISRAGHAMLVQNPEGFEAEVMAFIS